MDLDFLCKKVLSHFIFSYFKIIVPAGFFPSSRANKTGWVKQSHKLTLSEIHVISSKKKKQTISMSGLTVTPELARVQFHLIYRITV